MAEAPLSDPSDPYAPPPTFWQEHGAWLAPVSVFVSTVILTVMAFPPNSAPEFAYAFASPALLWAYARPRFRVYAWTLFAAQAVAWIILLGWLRHVTWVGLFLLGPFVGAWVGCWYLAAWWAAPRLPERPALVRMLVQLGLAGLWVVIEWTRTWFVTGFSWLPLAASQWQRASILQIASYTGAYGVSFVLMTMNVGFAAYAHRLLREQDRSLFRRRSPEFMLALFLLLVCLTTQVREMVHRSAYTGSLARVAFVQPDIPQSVKWDPSEAPRIAATLQRLNQAAGASLPELILWPESAVPGPVKGDPQLRDWVAGLATRARAPMLIGSNAVETGADGTKWYDAAFVVAPGSGVQAAYYAKRHLVPFGEYVPLRPVLGWISKFVPLDNDASPGRDASPLLVRVPGATLALGPLICYEDVFPQLARDSVRSGADVLAVLTNDAWYGEGGAAYQHAAHSVLRAVETRRPVLRCGNAGWSGWIDEFGGIRAVLADQTGSVYLRGTETVNITRDRRWEGVQSFYVRHGDWFVAVSALLAVFGYALLTFGVRPARPLSSLSPRR
jgi:apolipoprotein N-acyltransferase